MKLIKLGAQKSPGELPPGLKKIRLFSSADHFRMHKQDFLRNDLQVSITRIYACIFRTIVFAYHQD